MNCQDCRERLDDLLDGELSAGARRQVENHLAECASCREELTALESLVQSAHQLAEEIQPARDLWPEVRSRLEADHRGRGISWPLRLAAALILLALSLPLARWRIDRTPGEARPVTELESQRPPASALAAQARSEDGVLLARADLVTAIERRRDVVEDETLRALAKNVDLLDRAIGEIRSALEEDPHNLYLRMQLAARYQQERKLLQIVSRV